MTPQDVAKLSEWGMRLIWQQQVVMCRNNCLMRVYKNRSGGKWVALTYHHGMASVFWCDLGRCLGYTYTLLGSPTEYYNVSGRHENMDLIHAILKEM